MMNKKREESLIRLCQELVKIPSLSGKEEKAARAVKRNMEVLDYDEIWCDKYGSVVGHIKGNKPGKTILLDGHIDTVDISDKSLWVHDPFGAEIEEGRIYGRGTTDMKGPVAAMLVAASSYKQDLKSNFNGDIYVSCSVHEECFEGVSGREINNKVKPDYVVIGEPSSLNLKRGQKGRAEIVIETRGQTAHSSNPQAGINAVYSMTKVINSIKELELVRHEVLGEGILELTDIISKPYPGASVVPNLCRVTYDRRTLVGETKESVINQINNVINLLKKADQTFEAEVYYATGQAQCWTGENIEVERFFPAWLYDEKHEFVQKAFKGLKNVGLPSTISHYAFCTNGSYYAGEKNIPTVGFGPSKEHLAHIIDEYIEIDQLIKGCQGFYGILDSMMS